MVDADDLAAFVRKLHLGKVYIVGHSYGALTALFLTIRHPELIRAVVFAEPPAVSLLRDLPDEQTAKGDRMFADIQARMVNPMRAAFAKGDKEAGVATFINYVFDNPSAWAKMSPSDRADTLRDAHEWDVMMTSGILFPESDPAAIHAITVPVLVMSGGVSYNFLVYIDREIVRLIPQSRSIVYPDAGHQMWYKYPKLCRDDTDRKKAVLRNPATFVAPNDSVFSGKIAPWPQRRAALSSDGRAGHNSPGDNDHGEVNSWKSYGGHCRTIGAGPDSEILLRYSGLPTEREGR